MTTTWNPSDKSSNITLSGGNLIATHSTTSVGGVRSTSSYSTGKWYWEITLGPVSDLVIGLANSTYSLSTSDNVGADLNSVGWYPYFNDVIVNDAILATIQAGTQNDVIGFAWDADNKLLWIRTNAGNWNNSGTANPATSTGGLSLSSLHAGPFFIVLGSDKSGDAGTLNVGATSFANAAPSGFTAWDSGGVTANPRSFVMIL